MPTPRPVPARIEDHALVGNTTTGALLRRDGTVNWLCLPRFDSSAVFAELLGQHEHGFWRIGPARYDGTAPEPAARSTYLGDSLVLRQEWDTEAGAIAVTSFMTAPDPSGYVAPQLVRIVEGLSGEVRVASVFRPAPGYGTAPFDIDRTSTGPHHRLVASSGGDSFWLDGPLHSAGKRRVCRADVAVRPGERLVFALTWQAAHLPAPPVADGEAALDSTLAYWAAWTSTLTHRGPDQEAVIRSAITLKALCHPDGGIVAAPTTSLPEVIGGERNWDYRFCWPRDSAWTIAALLRLGSTTEAAAWRTWLTTHIDPAHLQPIYRLDGGTGLEEMTLDHLPGYAASRPVRIGNGAAAQLQLDVYGEIADTLLLAEDAGLPPCPKTDALLLALAHRLERIWCDPDAGIWEIRGPRRHFTHSKVMAWVCFDRVHRLLARRPHTDHRTLLRLAELRDAVHADVCNDGYDPERNTFTQYYGSTNLDASLLQLPLLGFLPADDKRIIGTVEAVQRELATPDGLVERYPTREAAGANVDGLAGHEGAFVACSFWLAQALAAIGRTGEARELLDRLLALRSDLGLLAEEYDPVAGRQLGNYPQAFSHWTMIDAAVQLGAQPRRRVTGGGRRPVPAGRAAAQRPPALARTGVAR
ncbi:glycoside hydrolase family 15 protein [Kitasatospora sp. NPDC001664]